MQPFNTSFTLESAMAVLDKPYRGIPFDAIEFLYNHPADARLSKAILYNLQYAYVDEAQIDPDSELIPPTALWYAIVAENHLSPELIDPVIFLLSSTDEDWDYLTEQTAYVFCCLAEKYPELVIPKTLFIIDKLAGRKAFLPYLYLFDALFYADVNQYKEPILNILSKAPFPYYESFALHVAYVKLQDAVPIIERLLQYHTEKEPKEKITYNELKYALEILKTGRVANPDLEKPYNRFRSNWKEHYQNFVTNFIEAYDNPESLDVNLEEDYDVFDDFDYDEKPAMPALNLHIGRNAPCPCGSGLKYKKCCGKDKFN